MLNRATSHLKILKISELNVWEKLKREGSPLSFTLEVTARCNNNCRHCYINLPESSPKAKTNELSLSEIKSIVDEAVSCGTLWCLLTGGEPLIRDDFEDIYLYLKNKGLLVSVFTNATLIKDRHVRLFRKYPPHELEVTVYGVSKQIYGDVTRRPDLFSDFKRGLNALTEGGVPVNLKTVVMQSNLSEFEEIAAFCRSRSASSFRFDPFLQLRLDGDFMRNKEIRSQRLTVDQIIALEKGDIDRINRMKKICGQLIIEQFADRVREELFLCGAGTGQFSVSWNGEFRLCGSLVNPECTYDLRKGSLEKALTIKVDQVRRKRSKRVAYMNRCGSCPIVNLCMWCPASAYLETGEMDMPILEFCKIAEARMQMLEDELNAQKNSNRR